MGEQAGRGAAVDSVVNGVVTGVWYALPDVVASRRARGWLKAALVLGGGLSLRLSGAHAAQDDHEAPDAGSVAGPGAPAAEPARTSVAALVANEPVIDAASLGLVPAPRQRARAVAVAVALTALGVVGMVAAERAIHGWGERLTARGVRGAHTRIGLVAGIATGAVTWVSARRLHD